MATIAEIRGRAPGAGSEFVLATDIRFASEKAILGQFEVGSAPSPAAARWRAWGAWPAVGAHPGRTLAGDERRGKPRRFKLAVPRQVGRALLEFFVR